MTELTTPPIALPPELGKKGWKLLKSGSDGKYRAKNYTLSKFSSAFDTPEEAIAAARQLDAGKSQSLNGKTGAIEFTSIEIANTPAAGEVLLFEIARLNRTAGTQLRSGLDQPTVDRYVEDKEKGDEFPPSTVFFDGKQHILAAGFHRTAADEKRGFTKTLIEIRLGTLRDAILFAAGENAQHGLPRTHEDKNRAVTTLLTDSEWSLLSDNTIAKRANVSQPFVSKLRRLMKVEGPAIRRSASGREINTTNIGRKKKDPTRPLLAQFAVEAPPEVDAKEQFFDGVDIASDRISLDVPDVVVDQEIVEPDDSILRQLRGFVARGTAATRAVESLGVGARARRRFSNRKVNHAARAAWPEDEISISLHLNPGKSARRGLVISGVAGGGKPISRKGLTLADFGPLLPRPIVELVAALKKSATRSKTPATKTPATKGSAKKKAVVKKNRAAYGGRK